MLSRVAPSLALALLPALAVAATARTARGADAKTECIAAADQGQTLRDDGRYGAARDALARCARDVCPGLIARACSGWLQQLDAAMPTVVLGARDEHGDELSTVHVTVDGQPLVDRLDGAAVAVDPGEHVLRFEQDGRIPAEVRLTLHSGDKSRVVRVTLAGAAAAPVVPFATPPSPPISASGERSPSSAPSPAPEGPGSSSPAPAPFGSARNVTALSLLVAAGVAAGAGAALSSQSGSESRTAARIRGTLSSSACAHDPTSESCGQLSDAVDAQHRDAALGASMLVGAGALAVAAVVTWVAWPARRERSATGWLVPGVAGPASLGVGGAF